MTDRGHRRCRGERPGAPACDYVDGWLLYDYRGMNPIFWDTVGAIDNVTRPCWLWIPAEGDLELLVSYVDQGASATWASLRSSSSAVPTCWRGSTRCSMAPVASRWSTRRTPRCRESPRWTAARWRLVRGLGVEVVSSADTVQFATQRWCDSQLESHLVAAGKLTRIVKEAFAYVGDRLSTGPTEYDVAEFIRGRFREEASR